MKKSIIPSLSVIAASCLLVFSSTTLATADPILGDWATKAGTIAGITKCGGSFCIRIKTGPYTGKPIGKVKGSNGKYVGQITDPENNRTYAGTGEIKNGRLHMTGCAAKIFCRTQRWAKR